MVDSNDYPDIPEIVTQWNVGDRVELANNPTGSTGGTVLEIANIMRGENTFEISYRIQYDEGGEGWHPEGALVADDDDTPPPPEGGEDEPPPE
jgi:hypothetical protein